MIRFLLVLFLLLFVFYFPHAQNSIDAEKMAGESIQSIYDGVLVVRLASNARKTAALKQQITDPYSSTEQRTLYKKMLKKSNYETREVNESLMDAFSDNYNFSEVFFIYDTSIYHLNEGHQKGFFLGQNLEIDSTINLANRPYRMARYGSPLSAGMREMVGIVVMDTTYEDLVSPFPYKSIGFRSAVVNSEKKDQRLDRHYKSIVMNLNRRFHQFYQQYKSEINSSN